MLAWDVQSQSYVRLSKGGRAWTEEEDRVLRTRKAGVPWSTTLDLLSGRSEAESKRRLKWLRRREAGAAVPPLVTVSKTASDQDMARESGTTGSAYIATPLAFDYTPQLRLARHWSEESLRCTAALSTCEASYRSLRFSAEIVARAWPAGPPGDVIYARWVAPLDEWLRTLPLDKATPLLQALWEWCDHASFMAP